MLGETDRDCEIGDDGIGIYFAGVAETGGNIDGEDERVSFEAKLVDFTRGGPDWFAQKRFRSDAEEAVEND